MNEPRDYEWDYREARKNADEAETDDERRVWLMTAISALTNLGVELNYELSEVGS